MQFYLGILLLENCVKWPTAIIYAIDITTHIQVEIIS